MELPQLTFKNLIIGGAALIVSSIITGYFFSIGADLWQITKQQNFPTSVSPFWYLSVPLGIVGIALVVLAIIRKPSPDKTKPELTKHPSLDFISKRIGLYARLGKDLPRMRREIDQTKQPIDILFPSWNETVEFEQRDALIGDEDIRKAMEAFSTAVNQRNRRRKKLIELGWDFQITPADQDQEFRERTDACIDAYEKIRELSKSKPQLVLQVSEPIMQVKAQPRALGALWFSRVLVFRIVSTTDWFDVGFTEGTLINILQTQVTNGRINKSPIVEQRGFRVEQMSRTLSATITASFHFLLSPHVLTEIPSLAEVEQLKPSSFRTLCLLHKGDRGSLNVEVLDSYARESLGNITHEKSNRPNNEAHFLLTLSTSGAKVESRASSDTQTIAVCGNCGNRFLPRSYAGITRLAGMYEDCPKCGKSALITDEKR